MSEQAAAGASSAARAWTRWLTKSAVAVSAVVAFAALEPSIARADVIGFTIDDTNGPSLGNPPFVLGFEFSVNSTIFVTQLGFFDGDQDGLAESHDVGLFNSGGTLLASTTIASGTGNALVNQFRYGSVGSVALTAGTYTVGALYLSSADQVIFPGSATNFQTAPEITFLSSTFAGGNTLVAPSISFGQDPGFFGPNFMFSTTAVPLPPAAAMGFVLLGGLGVVTHLRKRRSSTLE